MGQEWEVEEHLFNLTILDTNRISIKPINKPATRASSIPCPYCFPPKQTGNGPPISHVNSKTQTRVATAGEGGELQKKNLMS
jgi:hypothetical protein